MPIAKALDRPQINADALYGAISIELLPNGTTVGQIPYWDGVQWRLVTLVGEGIIDITFESSTDTLYFANVEGRIYQVLTSDAVLLGTASDDFTADAVLA